MDPVVLRFLAVAVGTIAGLSGMEVAAKLPAWLGLGASKRRPVLVVLVILCALGIAQVLAGVDGTGFEVLFPLVVHSTLCALVLAAAAIDLEHMVLPNELTVGGALLGLATAPFRAIGVRNAAIGAAIGLALTLAPFLLYRRLRGRSGMGLGDAKLAILAGAWLGAEGVVFVVFLGAVQSVLGAFALQRSGRAYPIPASVVAEIADLRERAAKGDTSAAEELAADPMSGESDGSVLSARLPLGPFLALACIEVLFLRRWLVVHVLGWLAR